MGSKPAKSLISKGGIQKPALPPENLYPFQISGRVNQFIRQYRYSSFMADTSILTAPVKADY